MMNIKATFDGWAEMITNTPLLFKQVAESQGWNDEKIIFYLSLDMKIIKQKLDEVITNATTV